MLNKIIQHFAIIIMPIEGPIYTQVVFVVRFGYETRVVFSRINIPQTNLRTTITSQYFEKYTN